MSLEDIIHTLTDKEVKAYLHTHAINHVRVVGSTSRNEQTQFSDIDLLVEVNESTITTDYFGIPRYLEGKLGRKIDLIDKDYINIHVKPSLLSSMVAVW